MVLKRATAAATEAGRVTVKGAATLTAASRAAMAGTWILAGGVTLADAAAATGRAEVETMGTDGAEEVAEEFLPFTTAAAAPFMTGTGDVTIGATGALEPDSGASTIGTDATGTDGDGVVAALVAGAAAFTAVAGGPTEARETDAESAPVTTVPTAGTRLGATDVGAAVFTARAGTEAEAERVTVKGAATLTAASRAAMAGTWILAGGVTLADAAAATGRAEVETMGTDGAEEVAEEFLPFTTAAAAPFMTGTGDVTIGATGALEPDSGASTIGTDATGTDGDGVVAALVAGAAAFTAVAGGPTEARETDAESAPVTTVPTAGTRLGATDVGTAVFTARAGTEAAAIGDEELTDDVVDAVSVVPGTGAMVTTEVAEGKTLTAGTIVAAIGSQTGIDAAVVTLETEQFFFSGRDMMSSAVSVFAGTGNTSDLLTVLDFVVRETVASSIVTANVTDLIGDLLASSITVEAASGLILDGLLSTFVLTAKSSTGARAESFDAAVAVAAVDTLKAATTGTPNARSFGSRVGDLRGFRAGEKDASEDGDFTGVPGGDRGRLGDRPT